MFCPEDTPEVNVSEIALQGATVYRVNGLIDDCGKIVAEGQAKVGWFDTSTLKEPYRIEGKKTMGLELAEQLGWEVPDVDLLSDRRRHRADRHVEGVRRARSDRLHRQEAAAHGGGAGGGLRPHGARLRSGREHAPRWEDAHTIAAGIRVPQAVGDFLILRAVRESGGFAVAVTDAAIAAAVAEVAREEGFLMCPEGAATYAALKQALADGRIRSDEQAVLFNCATGLKYPLPPVARTLDRRKPIDFASL